MEAAELHSAFVFDCDACGRENFVRGVEMLLGEDTAKRLNRDHTSIHYDTIGEDGKVVADYVVYRVAMAPPRVTCTHCGVEFRVELWSADSE